MEHVVTPLKEQSFFIRDKAAAALSSAAVRLVRADEDVSRNPQVDSIRAALLRIESLGSVGICGQKARFQDLLLLEAFLETSTLLEKDDSSILNVLLREQIKNPEGLLKAYRYLQTVDWISQHIFSHSNISPELLEQIYLFICKSGSVELSWNAATPCSSPAYSPRATTRNLSPVETASHRQQAHMLDDYCDFINKEHLCAVAQAGISHAHLEVLKPFSGELDGFERALSHAIFYKRGLVTKSVAPISLGPANHEAHFLKLITPHLLGFADDSVSMLYNRTLAFEIVAHFTNLAAETMHLCVEAILSLEKTWRQAVPSSERNPTVELLLSYLLKHPITTVSTARTHIHRSFSATNNAFKCLAKYGVVRVHSCYAKHQLYCAEAAVDSFSKLIKRVLPEQQLSKHDLLQELEKTPA